MNLVFDLDNTIYSEDKKILDAINDNINIFMEKCVGIDPMDVDRLRRQYREKYGITLKGLMIHYNIDPQEYLEFVHNINYDILVHKDELLLEIFKKIRGNKYIFTNGSKNHAVNTLKRLGIMDLFERIFSIEDTAFTPKPSIDSFFIFTNNVGIDPEKSVFFDDTVENLISAKKIGFTTVLVGNLQEHPSIDFSINSIYEVVGIGSLH
jgi:putative hydrolase of the HAD superfamily